ncbi:acetolactate synthase catalytic subunit [Tsukamurella sp. 8F]|uniref:acetolactate synthase catalytic subunit n=1 Tax=unclassified Tsukamurella TaxID=2633480 RepID=UPI0023B8EB6E|nr:MULTISPECIES: acetolactate synthase catalytic subunit [unclassified Tsukamurella]MDF0529366.1 acetolactate synthase catalytic subunit [Tsukamurella sp. 8J]MDF0587127.1 acetolactate synthase catalytic subunit [Tsukamurella sp. 8F]
MSGPNTVAEVLAGRLQEHGVDVVFGQSLPSQLVLAAEDAGIRQIVYRTENAGGAMADGYARTRRTCGFIMAQNGPAATLLVPPLTEARHASIAVVALVQGVPRDHVGRNAFQEIDHRALFSGCAKWFDTLEDGSRAVEMLDAAIRAATSGRPGPAVLMVPKDVLGEPAVRTRLLPHSPAGPIAVPLDRPRPAPSETASAWEALLIAHRPLIVAGGGAVASDAGGHLTALADQTGIPVATTPMGKGVIPDDHPLAVGVVGNYMGPRAMTHRIRTWLADVDVVLFAGTRTNENGTDGWTLFPDDATYLHLDIDPGEIGRNYPVATRLVGDVRAGVEDLLDRARQDSRSPDPAARTEAIRAVAASRRAFDSSRSHLRRLEHTPLRPETVITTLDELAPDDAVFVADASYSSIWVGSFLTMPGTGRRTLLPRGMAGLGWGLPLALGAKAAEPDRTVVCLTGDGGFAHCWAEVETAVREHLPVVIVVLNNSELGYQKHAELVQFGRATSAVTLGAVDHAALARACGARGLTVTTPTHLAAALADSLTSTTTTVIDVITDPDAYPPITGWDTSPELRTAPPACTAASSSPSHPE